MTKVNHLMTLSAGVRSEALGALLDGSGLREASPSEWDASRSSQTLMFVKFGGSSPKTDNGTWAETLHSLRLHPRLLSNA